jgi:PleD family two-component response regulator
VNKGSEGRPLVVLVVNDGRGSDYPALKDWLACSSYNSLEAFDALDALDELSDFTMGHVPDVVLLRAGSPANEAATVSQMTELSCGSDMDIRVIRFSHLRKDPDSIRDIPQLDSRLTAIFSRPVDKRKHKHIHA